MKKTIFFIPSSILLFTLAFIFTNMPVALGHGYVSSPVSRSFQGKQEQNLSLYGPVIYEPQSLEAPKGFPEGGPSDGQIASAGGLFGGNLDKQSSSMWKKNSISSGANTFTWVYTANHRTSKWHYYMTKQNWNQNEPLKRSSLELIGEVKHDGSMSSNNLSHTIDVPNNRSGYHVILAVWDVADTSNAFYQVIDVDVNGTGGSTDNADNNVDETENNDDNNDSNVDSGDTENDHDSDVDVDNDHNHDSNNNDSNSTENNNNSGKAWSVGTMTNPIQYTAGETVSCNGKSYTVLQTHSNYGDANWSPESAKSLFCEVSNSNNSNQKSLPQRAYNAFCNFFGI